MASVAEAAEAGDEGKEGEVAAALTVVAADPVVTEILILLRKDYELCAQAAATRMVRQRIGEMRRILSVCAGPSFGFLPEMIMDKLARSVRRRRFPARSILMRQGAPQTMVWLARTGRFRIIRRPDPAPPAASATPPPPPRVALAGHGAPAARPASAGPSRRPSALPGPAAAAAAAMARPASAPRGGRPVHVPLTTNVDAAAAGHGLASVGEGAVGVGKSLARLDRRLREVAAREAAGDKQLHCRLFGEPSQRPDIRALGRPVARVSAPTALGVESLFSSAGAADSGDPATAAAAAAGDDGGSSGRMGSGARFTVFVEEELDVYEVSAADLLSLIGSRRADDFRKHVAAETAAVARRIDADLAWLDAKLRLAADAAGIGGLYLGGVPGSR